MRIRTVRMGRALAVLLVFALVAAACGDDDAATTTTAADAVATTEAMAAAEDVIVCELAYYTGDFAPYGPSLTADVRFPIEAVINSDPPLGRTWVLIPEDIGTVGEGQAARTCLEQHGAEILVSAAHEYRTYREFALEWLAENDSPLMPTVHGGSIPGNLGGIGGEPIFRAQGLDVALGFTGTLHAQDLGAESIVIFATLIDGFQEASDAAEASAPALGMEVLARIDVPAEQPSYLAEAQRIVDLAPDAVIVQAGSVESASLINAVSEAGASLHWIGETGWVQPEFVAGLSETALADQASIGFAGVGARKDIPAWDFYEATYLASDIPPEGQEDPEGTYHFTTYDLLVQTALAVEFAGSYNASEWAPAMFMVGDPPGTLCYTYADCLAEIRAGNDIDYEGVTGSGKYSASGVNDQFQAYTPVLADGTFGEVKIFDPARVVEATLTVSTDADCDANNVCDW